MDVVNDVVQVRVPRAVHREDRASFAQCADVEITRAVRDLQGMGSVDALGETPLDRGRERSQCLRHNRYTLEPRWWVLKCIGSSSGRRGTLCRQLHARRMFIQFNGTSIVVAREGVKTSVASAIG